MRMSSITDAIPPMHPEGRKFVIIAAVITLILWWWTGTFLGMIGVGLTLWTALFFRDPVRAVPQDDNLIISPADGKICLIADVVPPPQLGLGTSPRTRVSVFMNVFNVHVNRSPVRGTISRIVYIPGKFLNADLDKASEDNERQLFVVKRPDGVDIGFIQIAGLVARRIIKFVREGQDIQAGERVGLIRFGSRVDVFLPEGVLPSVAIGQTCVAGETVLARMDAVSAVRAVAQ
jgi:phosphatidylserine decarboxylase